MVPLRNKPPSRNTAPFRDGPTIKPRHHPGLPPPSGMVPLLHPRTQPKKTGIPGRSQRQNRDRAEKSRVFGKVSGQKWCKLVTRGRRRGSGAGKGGGVLLGGHFVARPATAPPPPAKRKATNPSPTPQRKLRKPPAERFSRVPPAAQSLPAQPRAGSNENQPSKHQLPYIITKCHSTIIPSQHKRLSPMPPATVKREAGRPSSPAERLICSRRAA